MKELFRLEQEKSELVAPLKNWPPARLAYCPAPTAWSTAQVLDHLVKTETEILAAARRSLDFPHQIGLRDRLGYLFIDRIFRSARKVKVPGSVAQVLPDQNPDFAAVLLRWEAVRKDLARFYTELSPKQLRGGLFRHPVSGWMDMPRILGFFSVHMVHHEFQLARLGTASEGL